MQSNLTPRRPARRLLLASALGLAALLGPLSGQADAREFRSADVHPPGYPTVEAVGHMGKLIGERTQGRYLIKVFGNSSLGSERDTMEQTKIGALDLVRVNISPFNNIAPETMVPALPFVFSSKQHMRNVLDGPIGDEILKSLEPHGFIGLAFYDSGSRSFYSVRKQIRTLDDLKGMKIRVQQSDMWVAMMQALGANATPLPAAEVYTALRTGVVDAAENNWPSYQSFRHYEVAKNYTLTEHSMAPELLVFSKRVWDTLPAADQAVIRAAAKESVPFMRTLWDEREASAEAAIRASGATILADVDKAAFQKAMEPVYARFAGDAKLQSMVKRIQETR